MGVRICVIIPAIPLMSDHTYLIKLCQSTYSVRVTERGERQVLFPDNDGIWLDYDKFVDVLCDSGAWEQVSQLVKLGINVLQGEGK